jgi:hypothetical protein
MTADTRSDARRKRLKFESNRRHQIQKGLHRQHAAAAGIT